MSKLPRLVAFTNGVALAAGVAVYVTPHDRTEVIHLPTDHYDFLGPIDVHGKTKEQIEA